MSRPKVCGIGMHKTGTSSLAVALYTLGYYVGGFGDVDVDYHALGRLDRTQGHPIVWRAIEKTIEEHDAVQDTPFWIFFRELDEALPGARFILTTRDRDKWIGSVQTHFGKRANLWDKWIFQGHNSVDNPEVYLDEYDRHMTGVAEHFADRPDDLLTLRVEEKLTWAPICDFLGLETPTYPFPRSNPASEREASLPARLLRRARRMMQDRFGDGSADTRTFRLYPVADAATKRAREAIADRDLDDARRLESAVFPIAARIKDAIDQPFDADGSGIAGDDPVSIQRRVEFEIRHTIGLVTVFNIDDPIGDSTVGDECHAMVAALSDWLDAG